MTLRRKSFHLIASVRTPEHSHQHFPPYSCILGITAHVRDPPCLLLQSREKENAVVGQDEAIPPPYPPELKNYVQSQTQQTGRNRIER